MRLGLALWNRIIGDNEIDTESIPEFLDTLSCAPSEDLEALMKEVSYNTTAGKDIITKIIDSIRHEKEYNSFLDGMMSKNTEKQVIDEVEFEI
jgi:hypothetical protein